MTNDLFLMLAQRPLQLGGFFMLEFGGVVKFKTTLPLFSSVCICTPIKLSSSEVVVETRVAMQPYVS